MPEQGRARWDAELGRSKPRGRERDNLMPYLMNGARAYCTLGEMTSVLRETWGF